MDNTKNDQYHLGKIKADIAFIVAQGGRAGTKGSLLRIAWNRKSLWHFSKIFFFFSK
jgi:hypothetical protein